MTPSSIAIAMSVTLLTGLLGGWLASERATARNWSLAMSVAIGLFLFRVSNFGDLFDELIPTSGIGWLPWIALAVVSVQTIAHTQLRIISAVVLGFAISLRLLWGSVYLGAASPSVGVLFAIAAWSLSIGAAIVINQPAAQGRLSTNVISWAILVASSVGVIVTTGSVTYAVAAGVVGIAVLANLLGASRLPVQGTAILVCLIGLSVAFSETSVWIGIVLVAAALAISYLSQEGSPERKSSRLVQLAIRIPLIFISAFPVTRLLAPSDDYAGYDLAPGEVAKDVITVQPSSPLGQSADSPTVEVSDSAAMPDPFAGFQF
ncbi:hypothetical protein [Rubripirellula reticaptiva]|uniref:Uncharacterized protein n=1 Tax=Rubripirellula reticaptiva TaxID=2528013 RepID=A0A5C6F620_9BACT|nr:hypothetical protein [Rubripirellula reticaptiva]TWU55877.1 hypothetical protein Poly59_21800 [Rubripirellula reticaptiva]